MKSRESATNTDILVFEMIWDRYVAEREASTYSDIIEEFSLSDIFSTGSLVHDVLISSTDFTQRLPSSDSELGVPKMVGTVQRRYGESSGALEFSEPRA